MKKIYLYTRYERFWHWFQFLIISLLFITGFEIHGFYKLFGFGKAVSIHNIVGITWIISFAFFVFWIFTTGEWKHYIPTTKKMFEVIRFYSYGIFKHEKHPYKATKESKHNPLQRITYLIVAAVLLTSQMLTGFLYWSYNNWNMIGLENLGLDVMAGIHMIITYSILLFVIVHVYMTTTGHTIFAHLKAMITGWHEEDE